MSLIINAPTRSTWVMAQTDDEWAAKRFWKYVLETQFFRGKGWALSPHQPPTDQEGDLRRFDWLIERWVEDRWNTIICLMAKAHNCTQTDIDTLEIETYDMCTQHLKHTKRFKMYAMTVVGTSARLWTVSQNDTDLEPFYPPGEYLDDGKGYIEAHSTDAQILRDGFQAIIDSSGVPPVPVPLKNHPIPSASK